MSAYKAFLALVLFFGLFSSAMTFQQDFYSQQGVASDQTTPLQTEYDRLKDTISDMRENVRQVRSPESSVLDSAVAGLYLVPNFLRLILAPITIIYSVLDTLAAQYIFFPKAVAVAGKFAVTVVVSWSAFRLLIGLRG